MRGDQLARQWRILPAIESKKHGTTVAELASQEDCSSRTIWRDLATIEPARLTSLLQSDQVRYSPRQPEAQAKTGKPQPARDAMTMEVGGLQEVMSWVMGFGRQAEVLKPKHLRKAVAEELVATTEKYYRKPAPMYKEASERKTS